MYSCFEKNFKNISNSSKKDNKISRVMPDVILSHNNTHVRSTFIEIFRKSYKEINKGFEVGLSIIFF